MTILCHKTKMFPLIIAGALQSGIGLLGVSAFVSRLNVNRIFLEDWYKSFFLILFCLFVYWVLGGYFGFLFWWSSEPNHSNHVSGSIIFRTAPHSVWAHRVPFFVLQCRDAGAVNPAQPLPVPALPSCSGHKSLGEVARCSCLGATVPLGLQPGEKCGSSYFQLLVPLLAQLVVFADFSKGGIRENKGFLFPVHFWTHFLFTFLCLSFLIKKRNKTQRKSAIASLPFFVLQNVHIFLQRYQTRFYFFSCALLALQIWADFNFFFFNWFFFCFESIFRGIFFHFEHSWHVIINVSLLYWDLG